MSFWAISSPGELKKLLASARVQRFGAGEILFRKGDRGDKLFVVLSGRIMIGTRLGPGKVNVLDVLGEAGVFGEVALLDGAERAADAVALVESHLMVLERGDFVSFMDDHREAAQRLMAAFDMVIFHVWSWAKEGPKNTCLLG